MMFTLERIVLLFMKMNSTGLKSRWSLNQLLRFLLITFKISHRIANAQSKTFSDGGCPLYWEKIVVNPFWFLCSGHFCGLWEQSYSGDKEFERVFRNPLGNAFPGMEYGNVPYPRNFFSQHYWSGACGLGFNVPVNVYFYNIVWNSC